MPLCLRKKIAIITNDEGLRERKKIIMYMEELTRGTPITFIVRIKGRQFNFDTQISDVIEKKNMVLADVIYSNDKVVTFNGDDVEINILVMPQDDKPQMFQDVKVTAIRKSDNTLGYRLETTSVGKPYNRRGAYRCFVGIPSFLHNSINNSSEDIVIKDVSITGFAITCGPEIELDNNNIIHVVLTDYVKECNEKYSFNMCGVVVRKQELENGKVIYGCRLNDEVNGLDKYIATKDRVSIQKNGVNSTRKA